MLRDTNVESDQEYQRIYNGFYKVRRPITWHKSYYDLMQREKNNNNITFEAVLENVFKICEGRIETSFCSKPLATVRPDMSVYDDIVRKNLGIHRLNPRHSSEIRLENAKKSYEMIEEFFASAMKLDTVRYL